MAIDFNSLGAKIDIIMSVLFRTEFIGSKRKFIFLITCCEDRNVISNYRIDDITDIRTDIAYISYVGFV